MINNNHLKSNKVNKSQPKNKKIRKIIRIYHINLNKIKESIIKEVNIIELPNKCLHKKEKKD